MKKNDSPIIKIVKVVIVISMIIIMGITGFYLYEIWQQVNDYCVLLFDYKLAKGLIILSLTK